MKPAFILTLTLIATCHAHAEHTSFAHLLTPLTLHSVPSTPVDKQFSAVVQIENELGYCSATVVEDCLITAKHCLRYRQEESKETYVYEEGRSGNKERQRTGDYLTHPSQDLAVIKLTSPLSHLALPKSVLNFSNVRPESLPGRRFTNVGFGPGVDTDGKHFMNRRNVGSVRLNVAETLVYAYADPTRVVSGDSGGPLFALDERDQPRLMAVASYNLSFRLNDPPHLRHMDPARYSLVSTASNWLDEAWTKLKCDAKEVPPESRMKALRKDMNTGAGDLTKRVDLNEEQKVNLTAFGKLFTHTETKWRETDTTKVHEMVSLFRGSLGVGRDEPLSLLRPERLGKGTFLQFVYPKETDDPVTGSRNHEILGGAYIPDDATAAPELFVLSRAARRRRD